MNFGACEDGGESFGPPGRGDVFAAWEFGLKDVPVEEDNGAAGDVLCGSGDLALDGEVCEEEADVISGEVSGVPFAAELDELADAGDVGLLGSEAHVPRAEDAADVGEEGFDGLPVVCFPRPGIVWNAGF